MDIPIELYQVILERSNFKCQIRLTQLNKYLSNNLKIYDFCHIDATYLKLLSNSILKNYKYITKLSTYMNNKITDEGIKHMKLHTLFVSNDNITDEGIKHMNLRKLFAYSNNITDNGISHMNLHTLYAASDHITNKGISHMKLHTLYTSTVNITN